MAVPVTRFKENDLGLYFQDDWRVKDNLTLNLGLRWDFYQQASNLLHNEVSRLQQTGPNPLWSTSLPLSLTTVPTVPNHYHNFGPVVGFAWTPRILPALLGNSQTVIRGGFRIAYDFAYYNLATNVQGTAPYTNFANIPNAAGTGAAGLPNIATLDGSNIASALFPTSRPKKRILEWQPNSSSGTISAIRIRSNGTFGIERQIGSKMAAEARYVGNHTLANFQEVNGNPDLLPLVNAGFSNLIPAGLSPCTNPLLRLAAAIHRHGGVR